jgi:hypothetical protein
VPRRYEPPVPPTAAAGRSSGLFVLCLILYLLCCLAAVAPLHNVAGVYSASPLSNALLQPGSWLPADLRLVFSPYISRQQSGALELLALLAVMFAAYGVCAAAIARRAADASTAPVEAVVWLGALCGGLIFLYTPAVLATDIYSYAAYGRLLAVHHANPLFVPPSAFPHDPIYGYLYWQRAVSVYGPVWMVLCGLLVVVCGTGRMDLLVAFRALALAAHLGNAYLVKRLLRAAGHAERTALLGMQLYAWNPLVLFESANGGHCDAIMVTLVLLGLSWSLRAEQRGKVTGPSAVLPVLPLVLAVLLKYTALPILLLYGLLVLRRAGIVAGQAGLLVALGTAALLGVPFLRGHGIAAYAATLGGQVAVTRDYNSLLFLTKVWSDGHPLPASFAGMATHDFWTLAGAVGVAVSMLAGAIGVWRAPTTRSVGLAALAVLCVFLLLAPWFFPWYVISPMGLAAMVLPRQGERLARALVSVALVFSATAFLADYSLIVGWYLLIDDHPSTAWVVLVYPILFGLPALAFVVGVASPVQPRDEPIGSAAWPARSYGYWSDRRI